MTKAFWFSMGLLQVIAVGMSGFVLVELRQIRHDQREDRKAASEAYYGLGQRVSTIEGKMYRGLSAPPLKPSP